LTTEEDFDAVVIGGGPAGLSCALWLARYRRSVCVYDTGEPRNKPAWGVHGYPGISDPPPLELRAIIRQQAIDAGAVLRIGEVTRLSGSRDAFLVHLDASSPVNERARITRARRVVLAYGLRDFVPSVKGISRFYGHSVYHCPDCDGPSVLNQAVGVLGHDNHAVALALYLLTWASDVVLLTNGQTPRLSGEAAQILVEKNIAVHTSPIEELSGNEGCLTEVRLEEVVLPLDALFFHLGSEPRCAFAHDQGCALDPAGYIDVDRGQQTSVHGLYAAGDLAGHPHLAIAAAAEGVRAALAIHRSLLPTSYFVGG
jgi:thioredoxin reductase